MKKNWITILFVAVIVFAAILLMRQPSTPAEKGDLGELGTVRESDWVKGNKQADMVLIEYGDFQCSACASYEPILQQLQQEFGDRIAFVYRHFPLRSIHANAEITSRAAEAAGEQGRFWEMHDVLYTQQIEWSDRPDALTLIRGYAEALGLDVDKFNSDIEKQDIADRVDEDYRSAVKIGLSYTPSFILDGKVLDNPQGLEPFRQVIQQALGEAN